MKTFIIFWRLNDTEYSKRFKELGKALSFLNRLESEGMNPSLHEA